MTIANLPKPHAPRGQHTAPRPPAIDPERDIDGRSTTFWFIVSAIVFFVGFYFMLVLFDRVLMQERNKKIDSLATNELRELRATEDAYLNGDNKSKKTIQQVMKEMVPK
jgi:ribonucleotide reductase beta subunit family protein with ferritin-like domain